MNKTRISILAVVLFASLTAGFASARTPGGGSSKIRLPFNPYHHYSGPNPQATPIGDNTRQLSSRKPMTIGTPRAPEIDRYIRDRHEYPNGPYGTRVVKAAVSAKQINPANCRPKAHLEWQISQTMSECRKVDEQLARYNRSLWALSRSIRVSQAHYNAYVDVLGRINELKLARNGLVSRRMKLQATLSQIMYKLQRPKDTQVIWRIRNHNKRTYVPAGYLQRKAVQYVIDNPSVIGTTVQLNF